MTAKAICIKTDITIISLQKVVKNICTSSVTGLQFNPAINPYFGSTIVENSSPKLSKVYAKSGSISLVI